MLLRSYTDDFGLSVKRMHHVDKCKPGCRACELAAAEEPEDKEPYNLQDSAVYPWLSNVSIQCL